MAQKNLGSEPVFLDIVFSLAASRAHCLVTIRGVDLGQKFFTCPGFDINDLGICKHIEFTLGKLLAKRGGRAPHVPTPTDGKPATPGATPSESDAPFAPESAPLPSPQHLSVQLVSAPESPVEAADALPASPPHLPAVPVASPTANALDPWAAILEAGAALLQGLASSRNPSKCGRAVPPIQIERDPTTGQASVRLPLPDAAVLQKLAKALEPWLR